MTSREKKLSELTIDQILKQHEFPHRFYVYFASQCAKDALSKTKDPDPRSVLAVDVAERFGNGEVFEQSYLEQVANDAACPSASPATYTASAASASSAASAAYTASSAFYASNYYKPLLLELITKRFTKLERLLILGIEE